MLSGFVIGYAYDDRWNRMSTGTFFKRRLIRLQPMVIVEEGAPAQVFASENERTKSFLGRYGDMLK